METQRLRLKNLLTIKNGKDHSTLEPGIYPVLGSGGVMRYVNKYLYSGESVLLPRKGTLSNIQYINDSFWTVDTCYYTEIKKNIVFPYYLYVALRSLDLSGLDSGASIPSMTSKTYYGIKLDIPSLPVQKRISSILSAYDILLENNNKRIKILEKMAENLYKEWFVRFRFPGHELEEFENGIPKGWSISKLREIVQIRYGKDHKCLEDGEIPVFGSGGIMRYGNRALYSGETVMIPRKGSLNNVTYYNGDFWTVDTMFYTEFKKTHCAAYLYYVLAQYDLESLNTGASIPSLSTDILYHLKIIMPSQDLLARFEQSLVVFNREKDNLVKQNEILTKQRDLLLPRLMNGKLKV